MSEATNNGLYIKRECVSMKKYINELEAFIYEYCIEDIRKAVESYCNDKNMHDIIEELDDGEAVFEKMSLVSVYCKFVENTLKITALFNCPVTPKKKPNSRRKVIKKPDDFSMEASITVHFQGGKLEKRITCYYVPAYMVGYHPPKPIHENIIPFIDVKTLDAEAESFLKEYYPDALDTPVPVPIEEIASKMGLTVLKNYRLTEDFSIFGQICFEDMNVSVFDCENNQPQLVQVKAGTVFIDPDTFWQRNAGCVNNTLAHEIVHWHKHRWYPALCKLLNEKLEIACRCPTNMSYPKTSLEWTNLQSIEWQANKLAPRILMPAKTFRQKVEELYRMDSCSISEDNDEKLKNIVQELGEFYKTHVYFTHLLHHNLSVY